MVTLTMNITEASTTWNEEKAYDFRYFGISVSIFTILVGSTGNLFTLLSYYRSRKLRTTFNLFVVNLSLVDFITASMMIPFNLAGYIQMKWPFGNDSFSARLQAFFYFNCGYTSAVILVVITINRFFGVFLPTKYEHLFNTKRTVAILIFCWTFAPVCLLPFLVGTDPNCTNNVNNALTGFHKMQFLCTFICLPDNGWFAYMQWVRIMFQFFPLALMIVAYTAIFFKLRNNSKKLFNGMRGSQERYLPNHHYREHFQHDVKRKEQASSSEIKKIQTRSRTLVISIVICAAFMITFLPSFIINLFQNKNNLDTRWFMAASNLSWFNSVLNPIIYAILNPNFRKEYVRLIMTIGRNIQKKIMLAHSSSFKNQMNHPKENKI